MHETWTSQFIALSVAGIGLGFAADSVDAQHFHGRHYHAVPVASGHIHTSHHHHDALGHRIDDAGHHIDQFGHHTGAVGVYDNGVRSYPGVSMSSGYWSNGVFYQTTPAATVVSQPAVQTLAPLQPLPQSVVVQQPVVSSRPPQNVVPTSVAPTRNTGGKIEILNPADSGGEIRYSLNGTEYSIKPGSVHNLDNDRQWVISFGSGGTNGDVRYTLSAGTFKFKVTDRGWDLVRPAVQPVIVPAPVLAPAPVPQPDGPPAPDLSGRP